MKRAFTAAILPLAALIVVAATSCSTGPSPYEEHGQAIAEAADLPQQIDMDEFIDTYNLKYTSYTDHYFAPGDCAIVTGHTKNALLSAAAAMQMGAWETASSQMGSAAATAAWLNHNNCPQADN